MAWVPYKSGATIGATGSEGGAILLDEEYANRARITLEATPGRPWTHAITCGIYGAIVHTRFFNSEREARIASDAMKCDLGAIIDFLRDASRQQADDQLCRILDEFMVKHP